MAEEQQLRHFYAQKKTFFSGGCQFKFFVRDMFFPVLWVQGQISVLNFEKDKIIFSNVVMLLFS
jgi:hypothetical protein